MIKDSTALPTVDPTKPHNRLAFLLPKIDFTDKEILIATLEASDSMAQLKTMLTMSNRSVANTLDMLSPLFVPEAVSSSGIENIITTNDGVYIAKIKEERELTPAEKEALNYTDALTYGANKLFTKKFLATNDYIAIQKKLEPKKSGLRALPGTQLKNPVTGVVYYTPPEGEERIRNLLANFEKYFNKPAESFEIFARMAILHYQFEAIHPFPDGNGRTGRMLMPLYLMRQNKLPFPVLFISHYILEHRDEYYEKLREVTYQGKWKEWILFITNATTAQAKYTCKILDDIQYAIRKVKKHLKEKLPYMYSTELLDFLFSNAYFTQKQFEKELGVSPMTARKYLAQLVDHGIVFKGKQTGKNRYIYITPEYVEILRQA